jgi:hypothetical protein
VFSGTPSFLNNLRDDLIGVNLNPYKVTMCKATVAAFGFWNKSAIQFAEWIYKDGGIFMKRKHDIYQQAICAF